jgi:methyltransferase (TIGR00027 family)
MSAVGQPRRTENKRPVASTATRAAMMKAMEAHEPPDRRLFEDAVVARLLPAPARALVAIGPLRRWILRAIERRYRGLYGGFICRTRQIDDVTRRTVREGVTSLVILGSGFDTRAYRLPELTGVHTFEVDLPEVIEKKRAALARAGLSSDGVRFVALDFEIDDLSERLAACGWNRTSRTLFLWEGVTQYVARDAVLATLRFIAGAAHGSEVCFSYVPSDVIEGDSTRLGVEAATRFLARGIWVTGFEPTALASELAALGLDLVEDLGAAEYQTRYLAPRRRAMEVFEIERIAVARVRDR